MNPRRLILLVALAAFAGGFWTACGVDFDSSAPDTFSCTDDSDCIAPNQCVNSVCSRDIDSGCVDEDGDGFGAAGTDTGGCSKCTTEGLCDEDCNDNDANINPQLLDTCDGKDNDCDDEVDEVLDCEQNFDCPDEGNGYLPTCDNGTCVYKPPNSLGECAGVTLACLGEPGRETPPMECQ